jgi:hypothetical protein
MSIHFMAGKMGLKGIPKEELQPEKGHDHPGTSVCHGTSSSI